MRSELVFRALLQVSNPYRLCQLVTKATHKLHKPNTRMEVTISEVLNRFHTANPEAESPKVAQMAHPLERRRVA